MISRNQMGDIEFEIKFRPSDDEPIITYQLAICLLDDKWRLKGWDSLRNLLQYHN